MPVDIEFFTFTASEAFQADPVAQFAPVNEIIKRGKGDGDDVRSLHYGTVVGEPSKGYFILAWSSVKAHEAFKSKPEYGELAKSFGERVLTAPLEVTHYTFADVPEKVLAAPDTEIAVFKLKEGKSEADFLKPWEERLLPRLANTKGWHSSGGWGKSIEKEGHFVLLLGWESKELHLQAMQDKEYMTEVHSLGEYLELVHFEHTKLHKGL
ncbi:hypothetical protein CYLTODRAFT_418375 [Cylindrobasidium torrendii FP15055 ss-10]|uniref:ABM domain-containing protein n=1 Tax=Cylindrobasidium torrendii FP15055 ss-10 TaxID=1314674 RepID=A0A0D7BNE7_9AGAR|nr:hypothetical protein CYLTODRAFT_418375 [Cylindrobasidium torrendii FP15055 ss-10]